ncbi:unnamed protein product [Cyprideis torosa]|uniref:Serine/threonine-protein kinase RIO3 n=1 Tax=Cyprideis torosa TaxID=163714 RepID=A0A7R8WDG5_9CRUS|nr:unnamed protein product [Cyprideis torosa]CAG0889509.1 unnamed protein product [Cyprideis torosa]
MASGGEVKPVTPTADIKAGPSSTSPWGKPNVWGTPTSASSVGDAVTESPSFQDIMSEELARSLAPVLDVSTSSKDNTLVAQSALLASAAAAEGEEGLTNDEVIARLLQAEFDKEYNERISREAQKLNGNSKVKVSYEQYLFNRYREALEESDEDLDDDKVLRDLDSFEARERTDPLQLGRCGYRKDALSGEIRTKHDTVKTGRDNAKRVMELPPGMLTGDGGSFDMSLNNRVYNELKNHARSDTYRRQKVKDKTELSTAIQAMDQTTRLIVYKLVNRGVLDEVNGTIATGKESIVLYASGAEEPDIPMAKDVVIKVFKTTLDDYKTRGKYLKDDYRFKDCLSRLNPRTLITSWAQKELQNLHRMRTAGIPCPEPYYLKKHVLIMSMIGRKGFPAPKIRDIHLSLAEWELAYSQVVELMKSMYHGAELVHCDLSEYNILYFEGQCYFIDVSQAILKSSKSAHEYLYRDCKNICKFFDKQGVHAVPSPAELFRIVSGLPFDPDSMDFEQQIRNYEKDEECLTFQVSEQEDPFEFLWEQTHGEANSDAQGKEVTPEDS